MSLRLEKINALFNKTVAPLEITYIPGQFIKEFDGWRGIGMIGVLLAHASREHFVFTWVFMDMFFVLSGFLITGILLDTKGKKKYLINFISRRVLRVFPIYYLALFILFFLIPHTWLDLSYYRQNQVWFWAYWQNWLFSIEGFPENRSMHHFWSLAIEEQFYLVWPFLILLFSRQNIIRCCVFLVVFSFFFRNFGQHLGFVPPFYYVATLARMEGLALGAIVAVLIRTNKEYLEKYVPWLLLFFFIATCSCFYIARSTDFLAPFNYRYTFTVVDFFFACAITYTLALKDGNFLKLLLNNNVILEIGRLSYGIYIFHYPILEMMFYNFQNTFVNLTSSYYIGKSLCIIIAYSLAFVLARLSFKYIEMPFLKLKRYFG